MGKTDQIQTCRQRMTLKPRAFPYFQKIGKGRALGFRKTETGGSWIARRVKRQKRIGSHRMAYNVALRAANVWFDQLDGGGKATYTVGMAIVDYTKRLQAERGRKTARAYMLTMKKHVPALISSAPLDALQRNDIAEWLTGLVLPEIKNKAPLAPSTANLLLARFRAGLNFAWDNGCVAGDKPWVGVRPLRNAKRCRDLYLTQDQVSALLAHLKPGFKGFCKCAILTGARPGEVANIRRRDFIQQHGTLRLDGKTGERTIHLSKEALKQMRVACAFRNHDDYVFQHKGKKWNSLSWGHAMREAKENASLPAETVVYSLRHYYISRALLAGVSAQIIERNCGTSMDMISKYYGKFIAPDIVDMLDKVELIA